MIRVFLTFTWLGLASLLTLSAQNLERLRDLRGSWKFSIGDDLAWAETDYDDAHWEYLQVPMAWENQGFHGYDGFAWYRKEIEIGEALLNKPLYLDLGYIDDADEVYLNGELIGYSGGLPPYFRTAYKAHRRYHLPQTALKPGKNLLAIRVYDGMLEGGMIGGEQGLYQAKRPPYLEVDLAGLWQMRVGDQPAWEESQADHDWFTTMVPGFWYEVGLKKYDGYAWYQLSFTLPEALKQQEMVLVLGKIDDYDQVYIDGKLVGSSGFDARHRPIPNQSWVWLQTRTYVLPPDTWTPGRDTHVISVRVYDFMDKGGIYAGPVGLIRRDWLTKYMRSRG